MAQYAAMIRVIACIVAAALFTYFVYDYGYTMAEKKALDSERSSLEAMADSLTKEQARSSELNGQVQALLSRPQARDTIRTLIRENPSDCVRPAAITSGLQTAADEANKAIAASRNGDSLQADPTDK